MPIWPAMWSAWAPEKGRLMVTVTWPEAGPSTTFRIVTGTMGAFADAAGGRAWGVGEPSPVNDWEATVRSEATATIHVAANPPMPARASRKDAAPVRTFKT